MAASDFKFFLTYDSVETEVLEPVGWDAVVFTLRRSEDYSGLEFNFSDTLQFDGEGGRIIKTAYDTDGIDAVVGIRIEACDAGVYEVIYEGVINFSIYKETSACPDDCAESVTIGLAQSGLTQKFKNRMETPVDLSKDTGIDGGELTDIDAFDLGLHSKEIVFTAEYEINELLNYQRFNQGGSGGGDNPIFDITAPFHFKTEDFGGDALEPFDYTGDQPFFYSGLVYPAGITERTLNLSFDFELSVKFTATNTCTSLTIPPITTVDTAHDGVFEVVLIVESVTDMSVPRTETILTTIPSADYPNADDSGTTFEPVSLVGSYDIVLLKDCNFFLIIRFRGHDYSGVLCNQNYTLELNFLSDSFLNYYENSLQPPSTTKAYLLYEAFTRVSESITGTLGCFKSDFFGGLASIPDSYAADGCGRYIALTNGLNIRQLKTKAGGLFPISVSFKQLFDALNAIYSLGMRVEEEDGTEYIRVEPKAYFYNSDVSYVLKNVKEIERSIALELIHNEAEFGYQKWETETKNGIDEFNAKHNYSLPVIQAKRKLSQICSFVTGGYAIETARRLQFKTNPNEDNGYDNELFLISCNKEEVSSDLYSVPATLTSYPAGTVSERDENFSDVTGIISPETAYNLRFSPARMLCNWYPILAASLVKKTSPVIIFQSANGNYELSDELNDDCDQAGEGLLIEGQDIALADVAERLQLPYYEPELYQFDYPISFKVFMQLKQKAIYAIGFGCTDTIKGFIREVQYSPNGEGGIATFKLIKAYGD